MDEAAEMVWDEAEEEEAKECSFLRVDEPRFLPIFSLSFTDDDDDNGDGATSDDGSSKEFKPELSGLVGTPLCGHTHTHTHMHTHKKSMSVCMCVCAVCVLHVCYEQCEWAQF